MFADLATNAILHKDYSRPDYVGVYVNPELKDMFFALGLIESFDSGVRRAIENSFAPLAHRRCADPSHLENR